MIWTSWAIVIANPLSAFALAWLVLAHKNALRIGMAARVMVLVYVVGLLLQAVDHIELIRNFKPPRATGWMLTLAAQHGLIWFLFARTVWPECQTIQRKL